jgi:membrane protease YdiL (CAAX protease family)
VWPWVLRATGVEVPHDVLLDRLRELDPGDRSIAILLAVLVAPLLEEILFRAFLQPLLVQNLSDRLGIVVTSLVFAALHGTAALVPIFALSLLLGAIMLRTQRLFAVWAVHATHNALVFLLLYA